MPPSYPAYVKPNYVRGTHTYKHERGSQMTTPGPAPIPTHLKLVRGTARPDRINKKEPKPKLSTPKVPSWLTKDQKVIWKRTASQLKNMGLLFESDQDLLAAYAIAVDNYIKSSKIIELEGLLIEGRRDGQVTNPAVRVQRDSAQLMRQLGAEFGLTPSSRTRISSEAGESDTIESILD